MGEEDEGNWRSSQRLLSVGRAPPHRVHPDDLSSIVPIWHWEINLAIVSPDSNLSYFLYYNHNLNVQFDKYPLEIRVRH